MLYTQVAALTRGDLQVFPSLILVASSQKNYVIVELLVKHYYNN